MRILYVFIIIFVFSLGFLVPAGVYAAIPALSVSASGSGDSVQVTVNGDANANVTLYYLRTNYGTQSQFIGTTNSYGYLSTAINSSTYGIAPGSSVYVIVNNQQSPSVSWPYSYSYGGGGALSLSQTNVTLYAGQSVNITIYGGYSPYNMYTSSSNVIQPVIGGNTLTVIGKNTGSATLDVCSSAGGCVTLYATVTGYGGSFGSQISLSQNDVFINSGASAAVSIYGAGGYYISNNSNSNAASANISGNTVNIYGRNYGTSNITICQSGGQCAVLYVSVGYGTSQTPTAITFSQQNVSLSVGQTMNISISGGSGYYSYNYGNYYVAYNSNSGAMRASLNGNTLTLTGLSNSAGAIVVCTSTTNCGAVNATVGYSSGAEQGNWQYCANEGQFCGFSGARQVRYGANGSYYFRTVSNGVTCSNSFFGDPIFGTVKQCSISY